MDAGGVRRASADEAPLAYGEVVWSWRRDRGVYPVRLLPSLKLRRPSEYVGPA